MPTAVLMGMGLTPRLAQAAEPKNTFSGDHCVSQSDTPAQKTAPSARPSASPTATPSAHTPATRPSASPTSTPTVPVPSKSTGTTATSDHTATQASDTTSDSGSGGLLGGVLGGVLGGILGGSGGSGSTPSPSASPTPSPTASPTQGTGGTTGGSGGGGGTSGGSGGGSGGGSAGGTSGGSGGSGGSGSGGGTTDGGSTGGGPTKTVNGTAKGLTQGLGTPATPAAGATPSPSYSPGMPYPCPTYDAKALADAGLEQTPSLLPNLPWTLKADMLTLTGLQYDGIVKVETENGSVKDVMKFTASGVDIKSLHQIVQGPDNTLQNVQAPTGSNSTFRDGTVTMYTEELKGNLLGLIPVDFTPTSPPPLTVPVLFFTDVTVIQAGQFGGTLTIPGMHAYATQG